MKKKTLFQVALILIMFFFLLWLSLLQKYSLGQNYFVITVNNKLIGSVSKETNVAQIMNECRRKIAETQSGYLMMDISYSSKEGSEKFVRLISEAELIEVITAQLEEEQKQAKVFSYTLRAGDTNASFGKLAQIGELLNQVKSSADTRRQFRIDYRKGDEHLMGMTRAVLVAAESETEQNAAVIAASGANAVLSEMLGEILDNPEANGYETGILKIEFTEEVPVYTNYQMSDQFTSVAAAISEVTKEKETNKIYEIEAGDCLSVIAVENDTTVDAIVTLNGFENADVPIRAGDELILSVPRPDISILVTEGVVYEEDYAAEPTVVPNDGWFTSDEVVLEEGTLGCREVNAIITYENGTEVARKMAHQTILESSTPAVVERGTKIPPTYIKPLAGGRFSSGFGKRWGRMHKGVDWACGVGTNVYASSAGTVENAGWMSGYGYCVLISHPDGRMTRYAHNSKLLVTAGQKVSQGEIIALSGNTGRSTGPHVHFEIYIGGTQVNPLEYLN